ncbi:MAG: GNAT family N-acetyltransferase [Candidatus Bathyarchaeia archaeon]
MKDDVEICECQPEEVDDSLKELWLSLAREMFEIEHFILLSEANSERWVKFVHEGLASKRNFLLVAKANKRLVGFALASIPKDYPLDVAESVGIINDVYVLPEFRGKGIGKKLVMECLKIMKFHKVTAVRLIVLAQNETAIKLYEKLGFKAYQYGMIKRL